MNRERADFYRRRAIEKKYDSDSISPELQAYLEHTYSTLIKNPSPPIKLLPNIMVDLAGESDNREINEHVGWLYLHGVGVKQDENESRRRFQMASGSIYIVVKKCAKISRYLDCFPPRKWARKQPRQW